MLQKQLEGEFTATNGYIKETRKISDTLTSLPYALKTRGTN